MRYISLILSAAMLSLALSCAVFADRPQVSARGAVVIEASTGDVLFAQNERERLPMASTTKIMTALLAVESGALDDDVTISPCAVGVEGSSVYLHAGERLSMRELVCAVMLESANDAAAAVALELAGTVEAFADMMNERAAELALSDTHFTNPHGLHDPEHYTTALDLARLSAYAMSNDTFREISSTRRTTIPLCGDEGTRVLINHNKMLALYPDAVGVKTGYTKKSGRCLVSAAVRDGITLIAVTLDAPDDWNDHKAMLDYGFTQVKRVALAVPGSFSYTVPVVGERGETAIRAVNTGSLYIDVDGSGEAITHTVELKRFYYAPVRAGETLGRVVYSRGGKVVGEIELVAEAGTS